jgi:hypothetical protein
MGGGEENWKKLKSKETEEGIKITRSSVKN